jgi:hypothetical protein
MRGITEAHALFREAGSGSGQPANASDARAGAGLLDRDIPGWREAQPSPPRHSALPVARPPIWVARPRARVLQAAWRLGAAVRQAELWAAVRLSAANRHRNRHRSDSL